METSYSKAYISRRKRKEIYENLIEHSHEENKSDDRHEYDTDDRQEYDADESQGDETDGSQEDDPNVKYKKKHLSDIFCGAHETQMSEGGEADLHKHYNSCEKNPGHKQFVPVYDFNINHLPGGYHDNELVDYIKATADLTVRVAVQITSTERPEFWPNTKEPYAFYDKRGSKDGRFGSGLVRGVDIEYNKGTCPCNKCQHSDTPSKVWREVWLFTATHVVFDDLETRHTSCRLFYDRQDSPLVTLDGWTVADANIEEDRCWLKCVTCDGDLLDKLNKIWSHWFDLRMKVNDKYKEPRDKFTWIVSHPHGCSKQISVGHWIDRYEESDDGSKYTYTACTCPGSSGAHVQPLGYGGLLYYCNVHSGVNSEGINFSGVGRVW